MLYFGCGERAMPMYNLGTENQYFEKEQTFSFSDEEEKTLFIKKNALQEFEYEVYVCPVCSKQYDYVHEALTCCKEDCETQYKEKLSHMWDFLKEE